MKKLMIVAAIVCASAFAHAGYVNWSMYDVNQGGIAQVDGVGYLFNADAIAKDQIASLITDAYASEDGLAAWLNANALGKDGTAYAFTGTYDEGSDWGVTGKVLTNTDLGLAGSTKYTLYGVIFDDATLKDGNFYVTTSASQTTKSDGATTAAGFSFGDQSGASAAPGAWTALAPEPTTGLLMLIGMGALALRRRRA